VLLILALGTLMGALDSTIVILAFPTIADALHADLFTALWMILVYLLVVAITTTQLGRLGDIYGRSRAFNVGFAVFTAGSLFCGLSPTMGVLILSRAVQAFGGALMQANSGAIIADMFAPNERGLAYGYNSLGWTSGAMLGIVLGGVITTYLGWEYIFFINIPIGIVATALGIRYLRDSGTAHATLDLGGMILLGISLTLISYGVVDVAVEGPLSWNLLLTGAGILLLLLFIGYELRTPAPMIDRAAFSHRVLRYSLAAAFLMSLGYLAVVFLITMYLQGIRGLSPLDAALLLIPGYLMGSLLSPSMGRYADRYGARTIATMGTVVIMVATLLYLTLRVDTPFWVVLAASAVSGIGTSMFFPANNSAVMASAKPGFYGSVSGVLRTVQNIGVLGSFVLAISVAAASIPRDVAFQIFIGTTSLKGGVSQAFITGIDAALTVSLVILFFTAILSWGRGREERAG
jgi:EmrB/QacA subfamily drug resistance transporter